MAQFDDTRFAVIADIHGNADALSAVLDDIDAQAIRSVINLGDHVSGPMAPRECAEVLMARGYPSIKGNHDRWVVESALESMSSIDRLAHDELSQAQLAWLRAMPATLEIAHDVFACHGTPASDNVYWLDEVTEDGGVSLRDRNKIMAEADGITARLFLCGHSHTPRRVDLPDNRIVLNPGSVGCPAYRDDEPIGHIVQTGTAAACYAVVERKGDNWMTSFRHVPYDARRMLARAVETDHAAWVPRLATGWFA